MASEILEGLISGQQSGARMVGNANQAQSNAASWAYQSAEVGLKRQHMQQAQEQHDQMKLQFNAGISQQNISNLTRLAAMDNGPTKDAAIEGERKRWQTINQPSTDVLWASLKDKVYAPKYAALAQAAADPSVLDKLTPEDWVNLKTKFGDQWPQVMEKIITSVGAAQASKNKGESYEKTRTLPAAIQEGIAARKVSDIQLTAIQRVRHGVQAALSGDVKVTPQYLNEIVTEQAKVVNGGGNQFTEGSVHRLEIMNTGTFLTSLAQKLGNGPVDMDQTEWLKQILGQIDTTEQSYADSIDTAHDTLRASWANSPGAASAIDSGFDAYRTSMGKRLGGWKGYKGKKEEIKSKDAPQPDPDPDIKTPPPDLQLIKKARIYDTSLKTGVFKDKDGKPKKMTDDDRVIVQKAFDALPQNARDAITGGTR